MSFEQVTEERLSDTRQTDSERASSTRSGLSEREMKQEMQWISSVGMQKLRVSVPVKLHQIFYVRHETIGLAFWFEPLIGL
ncbi:hypothetical protein FHG87_021690 [Trinorchestia longiramus]|nr:hypothetical protein FHG87_021690 [Trinorchestia longiramus]